MNKSTHKTIRVNATMHTDLYADINVPIDIDENDIWQFIRDGNIDGGDMVQHEGLFTGGWTWDDAYDIEFNPKAWDLSKDILKQLEEPE